MCQRHPSRWREFRYGDEPLFNRDDARIHLAVSAQDPWACLWVGLQDGDVDRRVCAAAAADVSISGATGAKSWHGLEGIIREVVRHPALEHLSTTLGQEETLN